MRNAYRMAIMLGITAHTVTASVAGQHTNTVLAPGALSTLQRPDPTLTSKATPEPSVASTPVFNLQLYQYSISSPHFEGDAQMCGNYWLYLYNACPTMGGIGHCGNWAATTSKMVSCGLQNDTKLPWQGNPHDKTVRDFCSCMKCAFLPALNDKGHPLVDNGNGQACSGRPTLTQVFDTLAKELCNNTNLEAGSASDCPGATSSKNEDGCFAKHTVEACRVHQPDVALSPAHAYAACYESRTVGPRVAERVKMAELAAGDLVLTSTLDGLLATTRVIVNQHASIERKGSMLTFHTADGSALSLTPNHALWVDGALVAASEAKVGAMLTTARGGQTRIHRIARAHDVTVVNPVTGAGTILASDGGSAPLLAASHPVGVAEIVAESVAARVVVNTALAFAGDVSSIGRGLGYGLLKLFGLGLSVRMMARAARGAGARSARAKLR